MTLFKTLFTTLQEGHSTVSVTDSVITSDSIFEIYTDNNTVVMESVAVTDTTALITFDSNATEDIAVAVWINNLNGGYEPFSGDYNDLTNRPTIPVIEVDPILTEGEPIADISINGTNYEIYAPEGGSGNANIWYGTHAEYEAQSSTIADDTQVCFTDDIGLEAGSEYYSETEQIIGTYLGKPLYRICLNGNIALNSSNTSLGLTDEINVINFGGFIKLYSQNKVYNGYSSSSAYFNLHFSKNDNLYKLYHPSQTNDATYSIVIEYTKTTDSTVGVINGIRNGDNYSTTEQVIGTWLGKPLYSKVIEFTPPSTTFSLQYYDHNIANIESICRWEGFLCFTSGNIQAIPTLQFTSSGVQANACSFAQVGTTQITYMFGSDRSSAKCRFIIQYTKTTD